MKLHIFVPAALLLCGAMQLAAQVAAKPQEASPSKPVAVVKGTPQKTEDPALKADPATLDDARQLFDLLQFRKQFEASLKMFSEHAKSEIAADLKKANSKITPEETKKGVNAGMAALEASLAKVNYDEMLEKEILPELREAFTHTDLQQILAFYKSPAGVKLFEKGGAISQGRRKAMNSVYPLVMQAQKDANQTARKSLGLPEITPEPALPRVGKPQGGTMQSKTPVNAAKPTTDATAGK